MKIHWMGYVKKIQFPKVNVPSNAVEIQIDQSTKRIIVYTAIICPILVVLTRFRFVFMELCPSLFPIFAGMILSVLFLPIHEAIHCSVYPITSKMFVYLYRLRIVLFTTDVIRKGRYILFLIAPFVVLGVLPSIVWFVLPNKYYTIANLLYGFGFGSIGLSIGDIITLISIIKKMPANSWFVASENRSFYFFQ